MKRRQAVEAVTNENAYEVQTSPAFAEETTSSFEWETWFYDLETGFSQSLDSNTINATTEPFDDISGLRDVAADGGVNIVGYFNADILHSTPLVLTAITNTMLR